MRTRKIAEQGLGHRDIAFDCLTAGRVSLCSSILWKSVISNSRSDVEQAISNFRRSGSVCDLPHALLTRAWLRILLDQITGVCEPLNSSGRSLEIAERGPMPLVTADIHLYRARLFGKRKGLDSNQYSVAREEEYPWKSIKHDLEEARRLIEKHGYYRRREELEDAETALLGNLVDS